MKLTLGMFAFAALAFSQAKLLVRTPSGAELSIRAESMAKLEDETRARLQEQLGDLRTRLAALTTEYKPEHPNVRTLQSQIAQLEARVNSPLASTIRMKGNVEIRTETMVITADEADYHSATGEIEPRGAVRIKPILK